MNIVNPPKFVPHGMDHYQHLKVQCLNTSDEAIALSLKGNTEIKKDDKVEEADSDGSAWDSLSNWWNTHWSAKFIPDVIYINANLGADFLANNQGGSYATGYAFAIRGKQAGHLYSYETVSSGISVHGGYGVNLGYSFYSGGDARNFNFEELFSGNSYDGIADDLVIGIGYSSSGYDNFGGKIRSFDGGIGWVIGAGSNIKGETRVFRIW